MATVRQLLDDLSRGKTTLESVRRDFMARGWRQDPPLTPAQAAGVVDAPLPPADSIDWVDIHGRLTPFQRKTLRAAYDSAQRSRPGSGATSGG